MLVRATPAQKFGFFFLAFIIISVAAYFLIRQNPNIARSDKILAEVGSVDIKESQVKELVSQNVGYDSDAAALEFLIREEATKQLANKNSVTVSEADIRAYSQKNYGFTDELPEDFLLRETEHKVRQQKLAEKVEGARSGKVLVANFDHYLKVNSNTSPDVLALSDEEAKRRYEDDRRYAESKIRDLAAKVKNGTMTMDAAISSINTDSRLGTGTNSWYSNAPAVSGDWTSEQYVTNSGPFVTDPNVKSTVSKLETGQLSDVFIGRLDDGGGNLVDARFMMFKVETKTQSSSGQNYDDWYKSESDKLPVKRYQDSTLAALSAFAPDVAYASHGNCTNPSGDTRGSQWGVNTGNSSSAAGLAVRTRTNSGTVLNSISFRLYETHGATSILYVPFGSDSQSESSSRNMNTGATIYCGSNSNTDSFSGWAVMGYGTSSNEGDKYGLNCKQWGSSSTATFDIDSIETPSGDYYWSGDGSFSVTNGATSTRILVRHFRSKVTVNDNQGGFDVNISGSQSGTSGNTNYTATKTDTTIDTHLDAPYNPTGQYYFSSWSGCDHAHALSSPSPQPSTNRRCHATVGAGSAQTVTANYSNNARITVNSTGASGVSIPSTNGCFTVMAGSCSSGTGTTNWSMRDPGSMSTALTAPATAGGLAFGSWTNCDSVSGRTCNVSVGAGNHQTVTVNYVSIPDSTLSITLAGGPSSGTFSASAAAGACGTSIAVTGTRNCTQAGGTVPTSGTLSLTAPAITGYTFVNWSGDFCNGSSANPCTGISVPSGQLRSITANYAPANMSLSIQSSPVSLSGFAFSCTAGTGSCATTSGSRGTTDWSESATGSMNATITAPDRNPIGGSVDYFFDYWYSADNGYLGNNRTISVSLDGANPSDTVTAMYRPGRHRVDLYQAVEPPGSSMTDGTVVVTTVNPSADNHCSGGCALANTTPVTRGPQDSRIQATYSAPSTSTDPVTGGQYEFVRWDISSSQGGSTTSTSNPLSFLSPSSNTAAGETTTIRAVYRIQAYVLNVHAEVQGGGSIEVPFNGANAPSPARTCSGRSVEGTSTSSTYSVYDEINPIIPEDCGGGTINWTAPEEVETATALYGFKQWNITTCGGAGNSASVDPANPRTVRARITVKGCENTITAVYEFKQFRIIEGR